MSLAENSCYQQGPSMKRWCDADTEALEAAANRGTLPDGRIATQERLALWLGFSRRTIAARCCDLGLTMPRSTELMSAGGRVSGYKRRVARLKLRALTVAIRRS